MDSVTSGDRLSSSNWSDFRGDFNNLIILPSDSQSVESESIPIKRAVNSQSVTLIST